MRFKITFLGGAKNVTGSQRLIEANGVRLLVDCGMYQERELKGRNWEPFPVSPETIDAVLLTHAHLDHCGLLPKLVREGFRKPIYCTAATAEIAEIILVDSANLQQEDAEFKKKRHEREGRKGPYSEIPLYTVDDAKAVFPLFSPVSYGKSIRLGEGIEASFHDAGHALGSASIKLKIRQGGDERTIIFSGDVGRWNKPILQDPTSFKEADYVVLESTYGDKLHESSESMVDEIAEHINATVKAGGNIIVPSFALERAQELLFYLNELLLRNRIPHLGVFVDSPMAVSITQVFEHHHELFDKETLELIHRKKSPFDFPGLHMVTTVDESKAINHILGTIIIIAGSGMCTGGRVKHHLVTNISRPESTILFVGYQAVGTLGRQIVDGATQVRILGQYYPVKAKIVQANGFSAHADRTELLKWLSSLQKPPRCLFIDHGEPEVSKNFASLIQKETGWKVMVPSYKDTIVLD